MANICFTNNSFAGMRLFILVQVFKSVWSSEINLNVEGSACLLEAC